MPDRKCLLIDDVDASLALTTTFGSSILREYSHAVRTAVASFANRRGWTVVPYGLYVGWALDVIEHDGSRWLVLDPLFPRNAPSDRVSYARRTRGMGFPQMHSPLATSLSDSLDGCVGIVDDGASTGRTLLRVADELRGSGVDVSRVLLCASTRAAREMLRARIPNLTWDDYLHGDWIIAHMRDGCPFLPFSGRGAGLADIQCTDGCIEIRLTSTTLPGGLWPVMNIDGSIRDAVRSMRQGVVTDLQQTLGRAPVVEDLLKLGKNVPLVVDAPLSARSSTRLSELYAFGEH